MYQVKAVTHLVHAPHPGLPRVVLTVGRRKHHHSGHVTGVTRLLDGARQGRRLVRTTRRTAHRMCKPTALLWRWLRAASSRHLFGRCVWHKVDATPTPRRRSPHAPPRHPPRVPRHAGADNNCRHRTPNLHSRRRHVLVERVWRVCVLDQHCWWRVWGPVCHTVGVGGSVGLSHVGVNVCFGLYTIRTLIFQGPKANLEARNFPVMCELVAF